MDDNARFQELEAKNAFLRGQRDGLKERVKELEADNVELWAINDLLVEKLQKLIDMFAFHYRDEHIPQNEVNVPLEEAKTVIASVESVKPMEEDDTCRYGGERDPYSRNSNTP